MNQSKKGFIRCFVFRLNLFSVIHIVAFINSFSIGCFGHEHFSWIVQKKKKELHIIFISFFFRYTFFGNIFIIHIDIIIVEIYLSS